MISLNCFQFNYFNPAIKISKEGLHKKDLTSFDNYNCQHKYQQKKAWTPLISKNVGNLQNSNVRQMFDRVKFIWATEPLALGPLIEGIESGTRGGGGNNAISNSFLSLFSSLFKWQSCPVQLCLKQTMTSFFWENQNSY